MTALALALLLSAGWAAEAPEKGGKGAPHQVLVARVNGVVTLFPGGQGDGVPAANGTPLEPGDELRTAKASEAQVLLEPDGIVVMKEGSVFRLPGAGKGPELRLEVGAALFKLLKGGPHSALVVRTPGAVAAVRGTEFAVELSSAGAPTAIGVFDEGQVAASCVSADGGAVGEVKLAPRQETVCAPGAPPTAPGPLKILLKHRALMRTLRARLIELKREYRRFPAEKRRELRERLRGKPRETP